MFRSLATPVRAAVAAVFLLLAAAGLAWLLAGGQGRFSGGTAGAPTREICIRVRHLVKPGDTLRGIAEQYGVTLEALLRENNIPPGEESIAAGQVLQIPRCAPAAGESTPRPTADGGLYYEVDAGDTCDSIAGLFNIPVERLMAANDLPAGCEWLWAGQVLFIPLPTAAPAQEAQPSGEPRSRLSLAEAEALVRAHILAANPGMNPAAAFPLVETTGDETWQRMGVQVFQVTEGVRQFDTFVIADGIVYPIGIGFGGMGVHTHLVTDLDQDGAAELVYAFSYGSGVHQSQVGILYPTEHAYIAAAAESFRYMGEVRLEKVDDATVLALAREDGRRLGAVRLVDGRLVVEE